MRTVLVVLLLAAAAIVGGVVALALGRGGEMAPFRGDFPSLDLSVITPAEVSLLHPPMSAWGYNVVATNEALQAIALAVTERDRRISELEKELAGLRPGGRGPAGPGRDG